jgi:manganese/zinc/iron transport system substrate-binding protein
MPLRQVLCCAVLTLAACVMLAQPARAAEPAQPPQPAPAPLRVVATTGLLGDVASHVGGSRVRVTALMGEGVDPHLYKASPGDVRAMSDADLILYHGLHLEGRMADVIVRMAGRRAVVQATDAIPESSLREPPEFEGHTDPHVWFDPALWKLVVERVRDALTQRDPAGKDAYAAAADNYLALLAQLRTYAQSVLDTVPPDRRILVTAHDAFGYFGHAFNFQVLAIQGISTDSEASLRDINALVDKLVAHRVPAVFIESSVPRKTVDALVEGCRGRGHNLTIGGELFSDALGPANSPEGTYIGMLLHNVHTIAKALGGSVPADLPTPLRDHLKRPAKPE